MSTSRTLQGSYPLQHVDSIPLPGEDENHNPSDTPAPTPGVSRVNTSNFNGNEGKLHDLEKGPELHGGASLGREVTVPAEVREWKDNIVLWDSKTDPENPKNWSFGRRYMLVIILGVLTGCSTFASAVFASAIPATSEKFGVSQEVMSLGTSLFMFGYVPGPLLWASLSELYGRRVTIPPMFIFMCLTAITATSDRVEGVLITRFFAGMCASAPVTIVGGSLADLFEQRDRGTALVFYAIAVMGGPNIAPIVGSAVCSSKALGWRWTQYITVIITGLALVLSVLVVPETYAPVLLQRKAARLRRTTGRWELHSKHDTVDFTFQSFIEKNLTLPLRLITQNPVVICVSGYVSFVYGILYLLFGAVPVVFQERGWTQFQASLPFIAVLLGACTGGVLNLIYSRYVFAPHVDAHGGSARPEMRLPPMIAGGIFFPLGFFVLGWSPSAGGKIVGLYFTSLLLIFQSGLNYLIDAFTVWSASAAAANTFLRSASAGALPLVAGPLINNLGVPHACTLLGCIGVLLAFPPIALYCEHSFFGILNSPADSFRFQSTAPN
ncbi:MFS multidrug transporter [Pseudohyphozyma bogoriensis]|nr:MFS multidrug transporter [Pseudohyphozyma bogoriensis]